MNEHTIVAIYMVLDDLLTASEHRSHPLAQVSDAEVLMVAVVAAAYLQNHQERALWLMQRLGYLSGKLSISRFNRRLHQLRHWLAAALTVLGEVFRSGTVFVIDSLPLPVCRRVRARRCGKVRGAAYCGYCAAKRERFFGWRLHLVCSTEGLPATFELLPASLHDLTPIHELTCELPSGACVYGDKGYNCLLEEASILTETGCA